VSRAFGVAFVAAASLFRRALLGAYIVNSLEGDNIDQVGQKLGRFNQKVFVILKKQEANTPSAISTIRGAEPELGRL
jgi:hypothetical protein